MRDNIPRQRSPRGNSLFFLPAEWPAEGRPLCLHLPPEEPRGPGDATTDGGLQEPVRPERLPHRPRGASVWSEDLDSANQKHGNTDSRHVLYLFGDVYRLQRHNSPHQNIPSFPLIVSVASSQASFLRGVELVTSGDYSSSVEHMEEALRLYLQEFDLCQADCEGISQLSPDTDFYTLIAGSYTVFIKCTATFLWQSS